MLRDILPSILLNYFLTTPLYLVWVVGIGLAVANRRRYPGPAALVGIALLLELLSALTQSFLNIYLPMSIIGGGGEATQVSAILTGLNVVFMVIQIVVWVLVLLAVFRKREAA